ncbi:hypothetical protein [Microseira wollei]|uniref:hypothetical protein n=1 Tax=Microseira wollei TaxID=467598 RepID=UPI001CFF0A90|nr:hypothetical protein [Microseira wollei]
MPTLLMSRSPNLETGFQAASASARGVHISSSQATIFPRNPVSLNLKIVTASANPSFKPRTDYNNTQSH